MKILFICRGNVGRSQIAEHIFNSLTTEHTAISAGTRVINREGNSVDGEKIATIELAKPVIDTLAEIDLDATEATRTQLTPELLASADIVVSMAEPATHPGYLNEREDLITWEIEDPKGFNLEQTGEIRDQIADNVKTLLNTII